jgi:uncharacterized membrane protein (DUF485 family)
MPDNPNSDRDLTPMVSAETDVARLGHSSPPPAHEQTADEDADVVDWARVAAMDEFKSLVRAKVAFVVPATVFFVVYYFALPVLVGWFPELMERRIGPVNFAYVFALSQFFMAWGVAYVYLRKASQFDDRQNAIIAKLDLPKGGKSK